MATPKKKHLIELMIEAGVKWPEGAEYASQERDGHVAFYTSKPWIVTGDNVWSSNQSYVSGSIRKLPSLCRNWHQTIVTRGQYAEAVADAESWAAWMDASHLEAQSSQVLESEDIPTSQPAPKYCSSVMRQMPDNSIEQLTADYHAKAAEADRLQSVADDALKAADDALLALEKAGELIGLVISVDTKHKQSTEPEQPEITDWSDLRVGDVIWFGDLPDYSNAPSGEYKILALDFESENQPVAVDWGGRITWPKITERGWRLIRRQ